MEFFVKPDKSMGLRKIGSGPKDRLGSSTERMIAGLPADQRGEATQIHLGLKGRAGAIKSKGAGTTVPLQLNPADPKSKTVNVQVEKPGDVKTIREMNEKIAGQPAERAQGLVDISERIFELDAMLTETRTDANLNTVSKYTPEGKVLIKKRRDLLIQKYQRDADTDGILTAGGPGLPGTEHNPYVPANETEMNYLEPLDYMVDPEGEVRQWKADVVRDGVSSPERLYADREKYMKKNPRERPEPPTEQETAQAGGYPAAPAEPKAKTKPGSATKPSPTETSLKQQKALEGSVERAQRMLDKAESGKGLAATQKGIMRLKSVLSKAQAKLDAFLLEHGATK